MVYILMATKNFYVIRRNSSVLAVLSIPKAESILLPRICFDFDDLGLKLFWQFPFMPFRSLLEIH